MTVANLAVDRNIDFADVQLTYEGFRQLATNPHLSVHGRVGFPDTYRDGYEQAIFKDICSKLTPLARKRQTVLDIGPGCANLPRMLIELCGQRSHRLYLLDSPEMLTQLPDAPWVHKIEGAFPARMSSTDWPGQEGSGQEGSGQEGSGQEGPGQEGPGQDGLPAGCVDALLCYSVLHYLFIEANPFHVVDTVVTALAAGGVALFGDIPNVSKRNRFFASAAGQQYHRAFTDGSDLPTPRRFETQHGKIDDGVLLAMMQRAQLAGCDAYLMPQPETLPMHNRRDDLIIRKP